MTHPVQLMGYLINFLKKAIFLLSKETPLYLRIGGFFLTVIVISISGLSGWMIEQLVNKLSSLPIIFNYFILAIALSSTLAYKSLNISALKVLNCLDNDFPGKSLEKARKELRKIVGRDVENLNEDDILRAVAETASENSVDGVFAPLFWIFIGSICWQISPSWPGPLAFALVFKASSTLDSMVGYRRSNFKWLGTASARLDDCLTFIPCRLVVITLPLVLKNWLIAPQIIRNVLKEGRKDISPNSGLSEAIFAHCADIRLGGSNLYDKEVIEKPILSKDSPKPTIKSIRKLLGFSLKLELVWALFFTIIIYLI